MNYDEIGSRVREARLRCGLSQAQLAEKTGYVTEHISHIETASTKLSLPAIVKIANVLGVSVDTLLRDVVYESEAVFKDELAHVLQDCSAAEMGVIVDMVNALKKSLRNRDFGQND